MSLRAITCVNSALSRRVNSALSRRVTESELHHTGSRRCRPLYSSNADEKHFAGPYKGTVFLISYTGV